MNKEIKLASVAACILGLSAVSSSASAGLSDHSFAWTHGIGSAQLVLNGSTTLTATNRGWVDDLGTNNFGGATGNYIVGTCGSSDSCFGSDRYANNYFAFDIDGISGTTSAVLNLYQPAVGENGGADGGFLSQSSSLLYTLFDVSGNPLTDSGLGIFGDLASGISYGSFVVDSSSNGTIVSIALNAAAVSAINGGSDTFFIGGTISPVPEPATYGMLLAGLGMLGFMVRRRNQAV
ncbi:MAG: hypothetical protein A4S08_12100 [Proteobacteria bacterium SG_bin4]|nr:MAG: hypothetical protein A4S08_12100 [Proteobacteria bacterium SG_bin4]